MSDCDVSAAENVDTTDEGYLNHLLSEKDRAIKELASALIGSTKMFRAFAPLHFHNYPKASCMFELQDYEALANKYLDKD